MSLLSAMTGSTRAANIEDAFREKDITSMEMRQAVKTWMSMYFERTGPEDEDECQRLPVLVVNKLCKTVFAEYDITADGDMQSFLHPLLRRLDTVRKKAIQQTFAGGECFIKPVLCRDGFDFVTVRRDCFVPFARDAHGRITRAGTIQVTVENGKYYTLAERRSVGENGELTIESRLFVSHNADVLGAEIPLDTLPQYADLEPVAVIPNIYNLGMVQIKTPLLNCVDGSDDGVAVYAPAARLIQNINRNERQLCREFENGASRIIASADMLVTGTDGRKRLTDDVFVGIDDDPETVGVTVYSPTLREASYLARKQEYLRNIESLIGLKRGILSEVEAAERTATEITSSQGDYNLTIQDFQEMWEAAVRELLETCIRLGTAYHLVSGGAFLPEKDVVIDWGDGVLYDRDRTWTEYQSMVAAGLLKPELAVAWYFDLPHETPADLERIRRDYMPEMEDMTEGDA